MFRLHTPMWPPDCRTPAFAADSAICWSPGKLGRQSSCNMEAAVWDLDNLKETLSGTLAETPVNTIWPVHVVNMGGRWRACRRQATGLKPGYKHGASRRLASPTNCLQHVFRCDRSASPTHWPISGSARCAHPTAMCGCHRNCRRDTNSTFSHPHRTLAVMGRKLGVHYGIPRIRAGGAVHRGIVMS